MAGKVWIYADGACEPINPCGAAAWAFVAISDGRIEHSDAQVIGIGRGMTNNVAELTAIAEALKWAATQNFSEVTVYSDSKFAVNLLTGRWRARPDKAYYPAFQAAQEALTNLKRSKVRVALIWVPREDNVLADELAFNAACNAWDEFERTHPDEAKRLKRYGAWTGKRDPRGE